MTNDIEPLPSDFSAEAEIEEIRYFRETIRKKHYYRSRLMKFRSEIVQLRNQGASYPDICLWLRRKKRVIVSHTTVMRYLKKLPEFRDGKI